MRVIFIRYRGAKGDMVARASWGVGNGGGGVVVMQ